MEPIDLEKKRCIPCEGGMAALTQAEAELWIHKLKGWKLLDQKIEKEYRFKNFVETMAFVNSIAQIAESEGHHPDLFISYNRLVVTLWTHALSGLTENDFILAAKIDAIPRHS